jgi:hypothetical protein
MESLPVQPAATSVTALAASSAPGGMPTGGALFASTFGQALAAITDSVPDGTTILPKATPREKQAGSDSSDASSMAGVFLNCFISNFVQPAPGVALTADVSPSTASIAGPATAITSGSSTDLASSLPTPMSETGPTTATQPARVAVGNALAPVVLSPRSGQSVPTMGTSWAPDGAGALRAGKSASSKSSSSGSGQSVDPYSDLAKGQPLSPSLSSPEPASAAAWFAERQAVSAPATPVGQPQGGTQSDSKQVQAASAAPTQDPGLEGEARSQSALWPGSGHEHPAHIQAIPALPPNPEIPAQASSVAPASQPESPTPTVGLSASDPSASLNVLDYPEQGALSSLPTSFANAVVSTSSSSPRPVDPPEQGPPVPRGAASGNFMSSSATDQSTLTEVSGLLGKFAGAEVSFKFPGNPSPQSPAPGIPATVSDPSSASVLANGMRKGTGDATAIASTPTSEVLTAAPERWGHQSAGFRANGSTEVTGQNNYEPEAAGANSLPPSSATPDATPNIDASIQPIVPAATSQRGTAPEVAGIQSGSSVSAGADADSAYANLSQASSSGPGKSGQQNGPKSGEQAVSVAASTSAVANNPPPDATTNLLAAHAPSVPANHASAPAPQVPASSSQPATTLSAWQNYDGGAGKIVRSASLSDSANGAEMHVELRAGNLGALEVHTVVHEGSVGAEIHVQGQEAHTLLAAGLPSLERALGERNLRVENISVYQDQTGGGMTGGEKHQQQPGSSPSPPRQSLTWDSPPQPGDPVTGSAEDDEIPKLVAGLSVRA